MSSINNKKKPFHLSKQTKYIKIKKDKRKKCKNKIISLQKKPKIKFPSIKIPLTDQKRTRY